MNRSTYAFIAMTAMFLFMFFGGWVAGAAFLAFFGARLLSSGWFTRREITGEEKNREIR
jgi:hypothetical protein